MQAELKNEKITGKEKRAMIIGIWQAIFPMLFLMGLFYSVTFPFLALWLS